MHQPALTIVPSLERRRVAELERRARRALHGDPRLVRRRRGLTWGPARSLSTVPRAA